MNEKIHVCQPIPTFRPYFNLTQVTVDTMKTQRHPRSSPLFQGITNHVAPLGRIAKTGVLVLLLLGSSAASANAQAIYAEEPVVLLRWTQAIGYQLAELLVSPIDEQCSQAFLTAYFARFQPKLDLEPTVPVLVEVYKSDPEERYRLAAVGALHAIGDEDGMQQVRRLVFWQPSGRVQNVSLSALLDYYEPQTFENDEAAAALAEAQIERIMAARQNVTKPVIAERQ